MPEAAAVCRTHQGIDSLLEGSPTCCNVLWFFWYWILKGVAHVIPTTLYIDVGIHLQHFTVWQSHAFLVLTIWGSEKKKRSGECWLLTKHMSFYYLRSTSLQRRQCILMYLHDSETFGSFSYLKFSRSSAFHAWYCLRYFKITAESFLIYQWKFFFLKQSN